MRPIANPDDLKNLGLNVSPLEGPRNEKFVPLSDFAGMVVAMQTGGGAGGNIDVVLDGMRSESQSMHELVHQMQGELSRLAKENEDLRQKVDAYRAEIDQIEIPVMMIENA